MLRSFSILLSLWTIASAFETPDYHGSRHVRVFRQWMRAFDKKYSSVVEEAKRMVIFMENWRYIHNVNQKHLDYELGLNQFADLTGAEFRRYVHGKAGSCLRPQDKTLNVVELMAPTTEAPASVDWTEKGVVTAVKNQGQCGSCWAFSTTGSIESASAIKTGKLISLSEQQLVDCSRSYGNQGCNGGLMDSAFKYVKAEGGLCTEAAYPYRAKDGICKAKSCGAKQDPITGYTDVAKDSETGLMNAVAKGPVSIAIEADQSAFQFYKRGILDGNCGTNLDHGVLVVGYGTEGAKEFWKVKNSWGKTWGEEGYIRMCKDCRKNGRQGECGILDQPSYPLV